MKFLKIGYKFPFIINFFSLCGKARGSEGRRNEEEEGRRSVYLKLPFGWLGKFSVFAEYISNGVAFAHKCPSFRHEPGPWADFRGRLGWLRTNQPRQANFPRLFCSMRSGDIRNIEIIGLVAYLSATSDFVN